MPLEEGEVEVPLPGSIEAPAEEGVDALPSLEEAAPADDVPAEDDESTE